MTHMDYGRYSREERQRQYPDDMRPVLEKMALFSDTTEDYLIPCEPNPYSKVTVRFRAARDNIDYVFFVCKGVKELMGRASSDGLFDYYELDYQLDNEKIGYHFEVKSGRLTCFFDMRGAAKEENPQFDFIILPGFKTPEWARGAVFYQIYADRFYNGDPSNDVLTDEYVYIGEKVVRAGDWYQYPASIDVRTFYGGDLQGVLDKLDYLQDLGVDAIYFNPLFVSPSNHKYDIQDYDNIDPHLGRIVFEEGSLLGTEQKENREAGLYISRVTDKRNLEASNALFIRLVEEAHRRGIKVIMDGVFNHCGSFNKWLDREGIYQGREGYGQGAYGSKDSPYRNYFRFYDDNRWPGNTNYEGWWGYDTLPKLNYEDSREIHDYILSVARKWVSPPYNADGWRLDVAADLGHSSEYNHRFWREFRQAVKTANPQALILAEHYGDASSWLEGDQWDTIMNYDAFMEPITWFLTGMQKHSDDFREDMLNNAKCFWEAIIHHSAHMSIPSQQIAMNELSNHDHSRFLTRTNHQVGRVNTLGPEAAEKGINKAVMREAALFQMTWVGAPTIYYGDEAGLCGFTDPDNRRAYPWGREDRQLLDFHKALIRIHKNNPEMKTGALKFVLSEQGIIAFGRMKRGECSLILLNNNEEGISREITVWHLGVPMEGSMERLMLTTHEGWDADKQKYEVRSGKVTVSLPKTSAIILKYRAEKNEGGGGGKRLRQKPQRKGWREMALEQVRKYFQKFGIEGRIQEFDVSSATVELAAQALGCEPCRIAKSLAFMDKEGPILIVAAGDARVDNPRYKARFGAKARMLTPQEAKELIGHRVGGVCPFGIKEGVRVYLDESLKRFATVFPACGSSNSAIELSIEELEEYTPFCEWIEVCRLSPAQTGAHP